MFMYHIIYMYAYYFLYLPVSTWYLVLYYPKKIRIVFILMFTPNSLYISVQSVIYGLLTLLSDIATDRDVSEEKCEVNEGVCQGEGGREGREVRGESLGEGKTGCFCVGPERYNRDCCSCCGLRD